MHVPSRLTFLGVWLCLQGAAFGFPRGQGSLDGQAPRSASAPAASQGKPSVEEEPPRILAESTWEGGSCRADSTGQLSYTFDAENGKERVHHFGKLEDSKARVLGLRCSRWRTGLLTDKHYYEFPGADAIAKKADPQQAGQGISIAYLGSKIGLVAEWGPVISFVLTARGPILLHRDGTVTAPIYYGSRISWGGWDIVKGGAPRGSQLRGLRGLVLLAVPGQNIVRAIRVPVLVGEGCQAFTLYLGTTLTASAELRPTADGRVELRDRGVVRIIEVATFGDIASATVETEEEARCRAATEEALRLVRDGDGKVVAMERGMRVCSSPSWNLVALGAAHWSQGQREVARWLWTRACGLRPTAAAQVAAFLLGQNDPRSAWRLVREVLGWRLIYPVTVEDVLTRLRAELTAKQARALWREALLRTKTRAERERWSTMDGAGIGSARRTALAQSHAQLALGRARLLAGKLAEATRVLRRLTGQTPSFYQGRLVYALALAAAGKGDEAKKEFQAAYALQPRVADFEFLEVEEKLGSVQLEAVDQLLWSQAEVNAARKEKQEREERERSKKVSDSGTTSTGAK